MRELPLPISVKLRLASAKLRGLGYLIESHQNDGVEPHDLEDVTWGLGELITELSQAVKNEALEIERLELKIPERRSPKKVPHRNF